MGISSDKEDMSSSLSSSVINLLEFWLSLGLIGSKSGRPGNMILTILYNLDMTENNSYKIINLIVLQRLEMKTKEIKKLLFRDSSQNVI